ncbi:MAG TPA: PIG-L family deacetylase [Elusimicrobiota bacterium]|nr:PIG-L family deacetylase [Elusimicrobiota bacterium]
MNILAIGPHPDDMEYGCGGTLLKMSKSGVRIHLLVLTHGDMGGRPTIRQKEQESSARLLRAELHWGHWKDTELPLTKDLIHFIEKTIRDTRPDIIFSPFHNDTHQDHRTASQATLTATRYHRNVLFYEVPTSVDFHPNVFVDIGQVLEKKFSLLKAHKSQVYQTRVADLSILENARSVAIFRGFQNRVKYAEGFVPLRLSLDCRS